MNPWLTNANMLSVQIKELRKENKKKTKTIGNKNYKRSKE